MLGPVIDLLELSAEIAASDDEAARTARATARPDRLGELTQWWAGVTGRWPLTNPKHVRLVSTRSARPAVVELATAADVGLRTLVADTDLLAALASGVEVADDEIDRGADLLLLAAPGGSAAPLVLTSLLTGAEPAALLPRGADAVDSGAWIALAEEVRDRRRESADLRYRPAELVGALASPSFAAACGLVLRSVSRRTPVVLEGTAALGAALLAADLQPLAAGWWQVADSARDPAQRRVMEHLDQRPLLDLQTGDGRGLASLQALLLLRAAVAESGDPHE